MDGIWYRLLHTFPYVVARLSDLHDSLSVGEPETGLLPILVDPRQLSVDVGAHRGLYVHRLLKLGSTVLAVDANPSMAAFLGVRFRRAILDGRLSVMSTALGAREGTGHLSVPGGGSGLATLRPVAPTDGPPLEHMAVPIKPLDALAREPVGFIKVDVEGHEVDVLKGAAGLIARDRPTLLVETEERHRPGALAAIRDLLEPQGYRGFFLRGGRLHPVAAFDGARDQNPAALNEAGTHRLKGRTYINNFVFAARDSVLAALETRAHPAP